MNKESYVLVVFVPKIVVIFFFHHLMKFLLICGGVMEMVFDYGGARFLG